MKKAMVTWIVTLPVIAALAIGGSYLLALRFP